MYKKIILSVVLLVTGILLGKFIFGANENAVMPSPNKLYRASNEEGKASLEQNEAFQGTIHEVKNGGSIQEAVKKAVAGDLIRVFPGVYKETVYIDKDDISFQGIIKEGEWPVLDGAKELNDAFLYSGRSRRSLFYDG